jgi:hypothetical protein
MSFHSEPFPNQPQAQRPHQGSAYGLIFIRSREGIGQTECHIKKVVVVTHEEISINANHLDCSKLALPALPFSISLCIYSDRICGCPCVCAYYLLLCNLKHVPLLFRLM